MIRDILGILSDLAGIIFVWWHPDTLVWYWKLVISGTLLFVAIVFHFLSKNRPVAKVNDYLWEENEGANKCITLFLNKNIYYSIDMLVSIYTKDGNTPTLCAIGYVKMDPENKRLHIQVVKQIDTNAMAKIRKSPKHYKQFFVKPSVTQNDVSAIKWE